MSELPAHEGHRPWAPHHHGETAVSHLENLAVARLGVATAGHALLDVGCGDGRRLRGSGAALAFGVDLTPRMLARPQGANPLVAADVLALPFARLTFDVVWCRLVIGHVRAMEAAYAELSRVCRMGGAVIVTDISAEATAAGRRRTHPGPDGTTQDIEPFTHSIERQAVAAFDFGLRLERRQDGVVDPSVMHFYEEAGQLPAYEAQLGLPLVLALLWRKDTA